jgi:ribonuclease Z
MAVVGPEKTVLVDCVSNPILRLEQAGIDLDQITDIILTHFHPDHVSGVPLLVLDMWLAGRRKPLALHGLDYTLDRLEDLMGFYGWKHWSDFFPVEFHRVPANELTLVLDCADFRILCSPVNHLLPTIGLRIEFGRLRRVMAYSCDTEPCEQVVHLGAGADVLIHEAAGPGRGHSSPEQAGAIASQAEVARLLLIHYPTGKYARGNPVAEARRTFQGAVELAQDFLELDFS